jgi:hypothetical protein
MATSITTNAELAPPGVAVLNSDVWATNHEKNHAFVDMVFL